MPFAKRGDVVHSEATSGFNNQKKSLLINGLAALGDSLHPLQIQASQTGQNKTRTPSDAAGFLFGRATSGSAPVEVLVDLAQHVAGGGGVGTEAVGGDQIDQLAELAVG